MTCDADQEAALNFSCTLYITAIPPGNDTAKRIDSMHFNALPTRLPHFVARASYGLPCFLPCGGTTLSGKNGQSIRINTESYITYDTKSSKSSKYHPKSSKIIQNISKFIKFYQKSSKSSKSSQPFGKLKV